MFSLTRHVFNDHNDGSLLDKVTKKEKLYKVTVRPDSDELNGFLT